MAATRATQTYQITGMDCAGCARTVETGVAQLPGVESCSLTFPTARLTVTGPVAPEAVVGRVEALGYGVEEAQARAAIPAATPSFWRFLWGRWETRLALLG